MAEGQGGGFLQGLTNFLGNFAGGYATKDPNYGIKRRNLLEREKWLGSYPLQTPEQYTPTTEPANYQPEGTDTIYIQDYKPANKGPSGREIEQNRLLEIWNYLRRNRNG